MTHRKRFSPLHTSLTTLMLPSRSGTLKQHPQTTKKLVTMPPPPPPPVRRIRPPKHENEIKQQPVEDGSPPSPPRPQQAFQELEQDTGTRTPHESAEGQRPDTLPDERPSAGSPPPPAKPTLSDTLPDERPAPQSPLPPTKMTASATSRHLQFPDTLPDERPSPQSPLPPTKVTLSESDSLESLIKQLQEHPILANGVLNEARLILLASRLVSVGGEIDVTGSGKRCGRFVRC